MSAILDQSVLYFILFFISSYNTVTTDFLMYNTSLFSKMYHMYVHLYRLLFTEIEAFFFFCIFHGLNSNVSMLIQKYLSRVLGICMNVNL